ncbi:hypothetical protein BGZ70_008921 [Mortierella alpina]|uniref:Rhomboid-type serine protease n=1 Tax=Mortierella alpina TaxID=64518 RepID=A0A9P6M0B2_MORAP|nr:hypothetical protein BGZ70_008921 [Mortierella alpina]
MSYSQQTTPNNGFKHEWHDDDRQTPIEDSSLHTGQQVGRQDSYTPSFAAGVAGTTSPSHSYSNHNQSHSGIEQEDPEQYPVGRPLSYFPTHHQPLSQQEYDEEQHQRTEHYHQMAPLQHAHSPLSSRTPDWGGGGYSGYQPQAGPPNNPDIPLVGIDIVSSNLEATRNGTQFSDTRTAENMAGPSVPHDTNSVYSAGAGVGSGANHLPDNKNMDSSNAHYQYGQAQQAPLPPPPPPAVGPSSGYAGQPLDAETGEPIPKAYLDPKVQRQLNKRKVWRPWFIWVVSAVQIAVLVFEFAKGYQRTNQIVQTNPFNPMIGPGTGTIIAVGARFVPCMRDTYLTNQTIKCPDNTALDCTLSDICGFTPIASTGKAPDQWFRFITPIFLHGGIVHILFNLMFQLRTGADLERDMGWWRIGIIYMTSGIVGFIFGGNFAPLLSPSMGASGAIFGLIGCLVLDLVQNWSLVVRPCWELSKLSLMILFSFAFGLLPFLDNFAHIGGFVAGILTGLVFMPVVYFSKRDKFIKLGLKVVALPLIILIIVLGLTNFYKGANNCSWCKYLSCLPINGWCDAFDPPAGAPTGN